MQRCDWVTNDPLYLEYHDTEWGRPEYDDKTLFEALCLEGFQSGLSWITVLRKRDAFRACFDHFDPYLLAKRGPEDVDRLMQNPAIIRHRAKIAAVFANAAAWIEIQESIGFSSYIWGFVDHKPIINRWAQISEVPASTPISTLLAKDLKKRGFKFCGPTTVYAFMQATGLVNDHVVTCDCCPPRR